MCADACEEREVGEKEGGREFNTSQIDSEPNNEACYDRTVQQH